MATIKDVAAMAGVSISTVSHVLNQTRPVSDDFAQRVLAAVDTLHYAPNSVARSLKINTTKTLGMLVPTSTAPFFAEIVQGVESYCFEQGYSLMLCNTANQAARQEHYLRLLMTKRVDGLLVLNTDITPEFRAQLRHYQHIPQMVLDWSEECDFAQLIHDNTHQGALLAVQYLLSQGHQRIACITGPLHKPTNQQRLAGVEAALAARGLSLDPAYLVEGDFETPSGYRAMQTLLALPQRPTAVFAFNDSMAVGALCAASEQGLHIPADLSIMGYDDIELARYTSPPLTTISHPKATFGRQVATLLIDRIKHKGELVPHSVPLEIVPELVIRHSVQPVAQG